MRALALSIFLLLGGAWLHAQEPPSPKEQKARDLLAKGKPYKALSICDGELSAGKEDLRFLVLRAQAYNSIGEPLKAERDARRALLAFPGSTDPVLQLGIAENALGRTDSAEAHLEQVIAAAPTAEAYLQLAMAHQRANDCARAMEDLQQVQRLGGTADAARVLRLRGECAASMGDSAQARLDFDSALVLTPRDPVLFNSRGFYRYAMFNDHPRAIQDYDRAIKMNPNYSFAFNNRGWSKYKLGHPDDAIKDITLAVRKRSDNPYAYRNLGIIRIDQGDLKGGCTDLRIALDLGYTALFGSEVQELVDQHCGGTLAPPVPPVPTKAPSQAPSNAPGTPPVKRSNAP
jgi:tetratricopeptide (TPR) repeat protein